MSTTHGIGAAIARTIGGTTADVRWSPQLTVNVDGTRIDSATAVEVHPIGENGSTAALLVFIFQSPGVPRTAQVTRRISAVAANATGDGFTATMASVT